MSGAGRREARTRGGQDSWRLGRPPLLSSEREANIDEGPVSSLPDRDAPGTTSRLALAERGAAAASATTCSRSTGASSSSASCPTTSPSGRRRAGGSGTSFCSFPCYSNCYSGASSTESGRGSAFALFSSPLTPSGTRPSLGRRAAPLGGKEQGEQEGKRLNSGKEGPYFARTSSSPSLRSSTSSLSSNLRSLLHRIILLSRVPLKDTTYIKPNRPITSPLCQWF